MTTVHTVSCIIDFQSVVGWSVTVSHGQRNYCTRKVFSDPGRSAAQEYCTSVKVCILVDHQKIILSCISVVKLEFSVGEFILEIDHLSGD